MAEVMALLAEEWIIGVSVCISLVIIFHIVFSTLLIRSCRKNNYDVGVSGIIPFVNIVIFIKNIIRKRQVKKLIDSDVEFEL